MPEAFRLREETVLTADLTQIADALRALDKQMAQKLATLRAPRMSIAFQTTLIETLSAARRTRQEAIDLKVGTKINLYDAKEQLEKSQSMLASDQGQLIETDAAVSELQSEKVKALSQFIADNEDKAAVTAGKADEARDALAKASARLSHMKLYAPIDGVLQQLSVTTLAQVVSAGQQLAVVTPTDQSLQVEALVANMDIGFVKVGQDVAVKLDAFPFTRFGALHGKVIRIASAAVDEQEAKRSLANATASVNARRPERARAAGELRLSRYGRDRPDSHACGRRDDPADPGNDRFGRHQDRQPADHRLFPVAADQDRVRGDDGALGRRCPVTPPQPAPPASLPLRPPTPD